MNEALSFFLSLANVLALVVVIIIMIITFIIIIIIMIVIIIAIIPIWSFVLLQSLQGLLISSFSRLASGPSR